MPIVMFTTPPKRILFIRPSALGDVCRSVPVIASIHAKWPNASIDWLIQSIRSKVRVLDVALDTDSNAPKSARRTLSKSESMLDRLAVWEGKNGEGLQKAIDNGDALGLAWVEFKPKYKEFKTFFKAVVKREN